MMSNPQSSTPPWLREEHDVAQPLKNPTASSGKMENVRPTTNAKRSRVVYWMLKIVTMCLCVLLTITAVVGIRKLYDVVLLYFKCNRHFVSLQNALMG